MFAPHGLQDARSKHVWNLSHGRRVRYEVISYFGTGVYYKIKQQRRVITEEEQKLIRLSFTEMGYDGNSIEFDRYEEQYPALMQLSRKK